MGRDDAAPAQSQPVVYQIKVQGVLGPEWADWFGGLRIVPSAHGETTLTGPISDQAALYGVLRKVRDLGLPLLSVGCIAPNNPDAPDGILNVETNDTGEDGDNKHKHR